MNVDASYRGPETTSSTISRDHTHTALQGFHIVTDDSKGELEVVIAPSTMLEGRYGYTSLVAATAKLSQTEAWRFPIRAQNAAVHDVILTLAQTQALREKIGEITRQMNETATRSSAPEAVIPPEKSGLGRLPLTGKLFGGKPQ